MQQVSPYGSSSINKSNSCLSNLYIWKIDMLFATLDPTTRIAQMPGMKNPDVLLTDTVGFIQNLPTNLIAAFRATLEELSEADVLMHVADISNDDWRKQQASVLSELANLGLSNKPIITIWNKIDAVPKKKEYLKMAAAQMGNTIAMSAITGEGVPEFEEVLESVLSSTMVPVGCHVTHRYGSSLMDVLHRTSVLSEVTYYDESIYIEGHVPLYLHKKLEKNKIQDDTVSHSNDNDIIENTTSVENQVTDIDWHALAKVMGSSINE